MVSSLEISVEDFKSRLDENRVEFILDLRNEDEFNAWKIEGPSPVATVNIPQVDFVGEEDKYLDRLPGDKQIIITCAHGDASKYSAEVLRDKGFNALGLVGGMDAWAVLYETSRVEATPLIYQIYRIAKGCMAGVIISAGEAVVIDAPRHIDPILAVVARHKAKIRYVFDTHLQADHISGGPALALGAKCDYCINPVDAEGAAYPFRELAEGAAFKFGNCQLKAVHTPGHTPGSTSLLLDDRYLFAGDAIMATTIGRPDLGGMVDEWGRLLYRTIHETFGKLGDDTLILPSHAASVKERDENGVVCFSLAKARRELELFAIKDQGDFLKYIESTLLENPARYQDIRQVNLGLLPVDEERMKDLEIGKNLCGMAGKHC